MARRDVINTLIAVSKRSTYEAKNVTRKGKKHTLPDKSDEIELNEGRCYEISSNVCVFTRSNGLIGENKAHLSL